MLWNISRSDLLESILSGHGGLGRLQTQRAQRREAPRRFRADPADDAECLGGHLEDTPLRLGLHTAQTWY